MRTYVSVGGRGDKLRILQVCSSRSWGGMEMHVGILAEQLRDRGHHVHIACSPNSPVYHDLISKGFTPLLFHARGYFHPVAIFGMASVFQKLQIQVIHSHSSKDLWTLVPAARLAGGVPVVLIKHIGTKRSKKDPFHRWIYANVAHVIAISRIIEKNLLDTHPLDTDKVQVIYHGLDLHKFDVVATEREQVRQELGISSKAVVVGTIGRLEVGKGHLEFLEMVACIARQTDAVFVMVGEATRGEEYRAKEILDKVRELNLGDRLILTGFRKDIPRVLTAIDIFVFPSRAEAFGLVLIEAMAAGLPVISSASDGVLDIVIDGKTGILVPPRNGEALTAAVLRLVQNAGLRKQFGTSGRQRVLKMFTIDRMVSDVEAVYRKVLSG